MTLTKIGGVLILGSFVLLTASGPAQEAAPAGGVLVVVDGAGKEQKLTGWKFTAGTRRLAWLAPAEAPKEEPPPKPVKGGKARPPVAAGPEALEFREEKSTTFVDGVLTLVPLDRLRRLDYDSDKKTVTARVAVGAKADDDAVLTGSTQYKGVNHVQIEGDVDRGDQGVAALKFLGGLPGGVRSLQFPAPRPPAPLPDGRPALVTSVDKQQKTPEAVAGLQALYRFADGGEKLLPTLFFKKTLKIELAKVHKLRGTQARDPDGLVLEVTLTDGNEQQTLTLLRNVSLDGKAAVLQGLLAPVPAGYKLFPPHTLQEVAFDPQK